MRWPSLRIVFLFILFFANIADIITTLLARNNLGMEYELQPTFILFNSIWLMVAIKIIGVFLIIWWLVKRYHTSKWALHRYLMIYF